LSDAISRAGKKNFPCVNMQDQVTKNSVPRSGTGRRNRDDRFLEVGGVWSYCLTRILNPRRIPFYLEVHLEVAIVNPPWLYQTGLLNW
jgi:hypothetical protein